MNPSEVSCLLLDLWRDLHDVRVLWQLAVIVWIEDPEQGQGRPRSDLYAEIWRAFQAQGIEIPSPQREVRVLDAARAS